MVNQEDNIDTYWGFEPSCKLNILTYFGFFCPQTSPKSIAKL